MGHLRQGPDRRPRPLRALSARRLLRAARGLPAGSLRARTPTSTTIRAHFAAHPARWPRRSRPAATRPRCRRDALEQGARVRAAHGVRDLQHRRQATSARRRRGAAGSAYPVLPGLRPAAVVLRRRRGQAQRRTSSAAVAEHPRATCRRTPSTRSSTRTAAGARRSTADGEPRRAAVDLERVKVYQASFSWDDRWFTLDAFYRTGHSTGSTRATSSASTATPTTARTSTSTTARRRSGVEIAGKKGLEGPEAGLRPAALVGRQPGDLRASTPGSFGSHRLDGALPGGLRAADRASPARSPSRCRTTRKARSQMAAPGPRAVRPRGRRPLVRLAQDRRDLPARSTGAGRQLPRSSQDSVKARTTLRRQGQADLAEGPLELVRPGRLHGPGGRRRPRPDSPPSPAGSSRTPARATRTTSSPAWPCNLGNVADRSELPLAEAHRGPDSGRRAGARAGPATSSTIPSPCGSNRETTAGELMLTYDPTPATWIWAWDNDIREDAQSRRRAWASCCSHLPTTADAAIGITVRRPYVLRLPRRHAGAGSVGGAGRARLPVSAPNARAPATIFVGTGEPNGDDTAADPPLRHRRPRSPGRRRRSPCSPSSTTAAPTTTTATST